MSENFIEKIATIPDKTRVLIAIAAATRAKKKGAVSPQSIVAEIQRARSGR